MAPQHLVDVVRAPDQIVEGRAGRKPQHDVEIGEAVVGVHRDDAMSLASEDDREVSRGARFTDSSLSTPDGNGSHGLQKAFSIEWPLPDDFLKPSLEKATLRFSNREFVGTTIRKRSLLWPIQAPKELRAGRVEEVVAVKLSLLR